MGRHFIRTSRTVQLISFRGFHYLLPQINYYFFNCCAFSLLIISSLLLLRQQNIVGPRQAMKPSRVNLFIFYIKKKRKGKKKRSKTFCLIRLDSYENCHLCKEILEFFFSIFISILFKIIKIFCCLNA